MCLILKVAQLSAVAWWWCEVGDRRLSDVWTKLPNDRLIVAAILLLLGQALNLAIYQQIGKDGVYYGFKLGRAVPWCTGFPFNVGLRHPQYVGVVLNIWSMGIVMIDPISAEAGLLYLLLGWCAMYYLVSLMEESGHEVKNK